MIDKSIIKENYSRMTDGQLIHFAETEGQDLTGEALDTLHEEFYNRNLDTSIFGIVEENKITQKKRNIEKAQESGSNEFINSIWTYAFDEKKNGKSDNEIQKGIMENGLDEEHSILIIKSLESKAKEILDAHDTNMIVGGLICTVGIAITLWTYSAAATGGGSYIVAWGAILFGAIRFFRGLSNKGKYKTILTNIQSERNPEINNNNS